MFFYVKKYHVNLSARKENKMAIAGKLTYETKIDKKGFEKGLNSLINSVSNGGTKIKNIVTALGITEIIGKAFSTITNSMDSAISRIDTLNNFPKVMSNLGISSEDSTKAINKLSEGLKGIPTKLDDASLAVQRFTSVNNDVNKSTDYFLALNNALLAGGASADLQANALEQLSQMYAVGTVDAEAWKSVLNAMPAQLQQVATSMGYTSTAVGGDFYNALQSGKISMEDFMQQIVKLNKEGTEGFASFEEQAKSATGGIQTAITNAQTAISRGVAEIIKEIDKVLQNLGLGGISQVIENIGSICEKALKMVAGEIPNLVGSLEQIIPVLAGIATGFAVFDAGNIIGFGDTVGKVFGKISEKAVFLSGILTKGLGFTALVGIALIALGFLQENFGEQINEIATIAIEQGPTIITNLVNGIVSEIPKLVEQGSQLLQTLLNVLIANLPVIVTGGVQVINSLITGISQQLPTLIPMIIQLMLIIFNALIENLPLIINAGLQLLVGLIQGIVNAIPQLIEMLPIIISTICGVIAEALPLIIDAGIQILIALIDGLIGCIPQLVEKLPQIIETIITFINENLPMIIDAGITLLVALINGIVGAIPQLIEMLPQIISTIVRILIQNFPKIVEAGGKIISSLIRGIGSLLGALGGKAGEIVSTIWNTLMKLPSKMLEIGKNVVKGIWNGIKNAKQWLLDKVKEWCGNILNGMKSFFGIHSPSTLFRDEIGKFIPQGVAVGIEADTDKAVQAIDNMNNEIMQEMTKAVALETGSISATASVKSNNSMLNVIQANFNIDGSVDIDGQKAGKILAPNVSKTLRMAGVY